ncbi:hypothetical protein [Flammeovirga aprica]|uniref:HNH endonuclease n=1 Tax=Flammeovirga aprica JL-4 TaxID=694437 RepID=A0A7X9RUT0_9BACT|nr:hypothetical protein [Flammeovirga aprica]NME69024.1 hypothetical protein [Flammeovirga aprica JL-4]
MNSEQRNLAWGKLRSVPGKHPFFWRTDPCGALIFRFSYGNRKSQWGWEVDHVYPISLQDNITERPVDGIHNKHNLRAMHWRNNKSKDNYYPSYDSAVTYDSQKGINVKSNKRFYVNKLTQAILKSKFGL